MVIKKVIRVKEEDIEVVKKVIEVNKEVIFTKDLDISLKNKILSLNGIKVSVRKIKEHQLRKFRKTTIKKNNIL